MSEVLKILNDSKEITKQTNQKLDVLMQLHATRIGKGILEMDKGVTFETVYSNGATVTIARYPTAGSKSPGHCHDIIVEYLICTKGSFSVSFKDGYRILRPKECVSLPEGVIHTVTALEDNCQLVAVCVPAEPAYTSSLKCD